MKNKIKNILGITIILSIIIFSSNTYAANTTNSSNTSTNKTTNSSNNSTSTSNKTNSTNTSSNTTSGTSTKLSDATLSDLGIKPNDFKGFKSGTISYKTTVPEDVAEVEVYAKTTSSKATVTGTGKKKLEKGTNTAEVIVTAENGTKKTYTIEITREGTSEETAATTQTEETTDSNENIGDGLSSLKIEELKIEPDFKTNVYEYRVKYIGEKDKLDIEAKTTNSNYTVEITGNSELKEGENIITILVSDANSNNIATYQVIVNKSLVDEEALAKEQEQKQKEEQKKKMMIAGEIGAGLLVFIIAIVAIVKHRQNKAWAEEYSVPYSGLNDDEDEFLQENEEIQNTVNDNQENDFNEEPLTKEKARETFLNNYNNSYDEIDDYGERPRRKHKGKRFK